MASNPSRQGTPITPTLAPLASPIHHTTPTLVPASPVSLAATIWHVQDLLTPEVISHAIIHHGDKGCVELRYFRVGREYFDYLGNN